MNTPPCSEFCPFIGCASCESSGGENPPAATVSDARTGVASCRLRSIPRQRETAPAGNRGLTTETSEESKWL